MCVCNARVRAVSEIRLGRLGKLRDRVETRVSAGKNPIASHDGISLHRREGNTWTLVDNDEGDDGDGGKNRNHHPAGGTQKLVIENDVSLHQGGKKVVAIMDEENYNNDDDDEEEVDEIDHFLAVNPNMAPIVDLNLIAHKLLSDHEEQIEPCRYTCSAATDEECSCSLFLRGHHGQWQLGDACCCIATDLSSASTTQLAINVRLLLLCSLLGGFQFDNVCFRNPFIFQFPCPLFTPPPFLLFLIFSRKDAA